VRVGSALPRVLLALPALGVVGLVVAGCTGAGERSALDGGVGTDGAPESAALAAPAEPDAGSPATAEPQVIVTGYLDIAVTDVPAAALDAAGIVEELGGRLEEESDYLPDPAEPRDRTVNLRARVPADSFDAALTGIGALGTVTARTVTRTDVTIEVLDAAARIATLTAAIDRLRELIEGAESTADLIAAETALAERQAELDSLTAQATYLADQTSLATLSVQLTWEDRRGQDHTALGWALLGTAIGAAGLGAVILSARWRRRRRSAATA